MRMLSIVTLAAVAGLAAACTSKTATVQPATAASAPAPAPMVAPAAGPSRQVNVTYTPPAGFPGAQKLANAYCTEHFGKGTAQLMTDSPPGRATFSCPGM